MKLELLDINATRRERWDGGKAEDGLKKKKTTSEEIIKEVENIDEVPNSVAEIYPTFIY